MLFDKITSCQLSLPIPVWLDGPWFTIREERAWKEADAGTCNITSVEAVLP
jgi:hypothetical protein